MEYVLLPDGASRLPGLYLAEPAASLDALRRAGFNVVTLGNNHVLDYHRAEGLVETLRGWILQAEFSLTQGARATVARARIVRRRDSRESRPGATRPGAVDLQSPGQQAHADALSHPGDHPKRGAFF